MLWRCSWKTCRSCSHALLEGKNLHMECNMLCTSWGKEMDRALWNHEENICLCFKWWLNVQTKRIRVNFLDLLCRFYSKRSHWNSLKFVISWQMSGMILWLDSLFFLLFTTERWVWHPRPSKLYRPSIAFSYVQGTHFGGKPFEKTLFFFF